MSDTPVTPSQQPETPKENIVQEVIQDAPAVTKDVSSIVNNIKIITFILAIAGIAFGIFKGCSCLPHIPFKIGPTTIKNADQTQSTIITSTSVTYIPKVNGKDGKPIKIHKPVEGKVTIKNGVIKIQNSGLTFVPKLGTIYSFGDKQFEWILGARFLFIGNFGGETFLNDKRFGLGADVRDPVFNVLTTSVGISTSYSNIGQLSPYVGEEATLLDF